MAKQTANPTSETAAAEKEAGLTRLIRHYSKIAKLPFLFAFISRTLEKVPRCSRNEDAITYASWLHLGRTKELNFYNYFFLRY